MSMRSTIFGELKDGVEVWSTSLEKMDSWLYNVQTIFTSLIIILQYIVVLCAYEKNKDNELKQEAQAALEHEKTGGEELKDVSKDEGEPMTDAP